MAKTASRRKPLKTSKLGALPEWNLNDLYPGLDSPEIKRDLEQADSDCVAFEEAYKGKLAEMAAARRPGTTRRSARRYEAIDDRLGRLISYASLVYAGNTTDPERAKFYGDVQERITAASLHLLFFTLELNRVDDALSTPRCAIPRWPLPAVDRRRAEGKALPARGPGRATLPREIRDRHI